MQHTIENDPELTELLQEAIHWRFTGTMKPSQPTDRMRIATLLAENSYALDKGARTTPKAQCALEANIAAIAKPLPNEFCIAQMQKHEAAMTLMDYRDRHLKQLKIIASTPEIEHSISRIDDKISRINDTLVSIAPEIAEATNEALKQQCNQANQGKWLKQHPARIIDLNAEKAIIRA